MPRKKLTPQQAKALLIADGVDFSQDFHSQDRYVVGRLEELAKAAGYRKSKNAPGSTVRMFYQYLSRVEPVVRGAGELTPAERRAYQARARDKKKTPAQLDAEIAQALGSPTRSHATRKRPQKERGVIDVMGGYKVDLDRGGALLRERIDTRQPGDYGRDPLGDGTFRMVPSGDIVSYEESERRLKRRTSHSTKKVASELDADIAHLQGLRKLYTKEAAEDAPLSTAYYAKLIGNLDRELAALKSARHLIGNLDRELAALKSARRQAR